VKLLLWAIMGVWAVVTVARFTHGIGATSGLTDVAPWGFWIAFDVMAGVALAAGGFVVAARQVWLQHLPPERVPQCGPDLYFMLENFPLSRVLRTLVQGTGECAVVDWTFLGFSIAEWSLGWFAVLFFYALWLALRRPRARATEDLTFPEIEGRYR